MDGIVFVDMGCGWMETGDVDVSLVTSTSADNASSVHGKNFETYTIVEINAKAALRAKACMMGNVENVRLEWRSDMALVVVSLEANKRGHTLVAFVRLGHSLMISMKIALSADRATTRPMLGRRHAKSVHSG
ncbi:hypothetical protein FGB62_139g210 [Gracilaria domingensis]|nr:hypothetical protein FGB62_139g210 [Gracilaria domingensis]